MTPDVRVFANAEALSQAAATEFAETAGGAVSQRGRCMVCLSGGATPNRMYALLAQSPHRDLVEWQRLQFYWGDERCVPAQDINSNYRLAHELLLARVPVVTENVHRVRTELEPGLAAEDYALTLSRQAELPLQWPRLDLVLLGLGEDGHTASLFPNSTVSAGLAAIAVHSISATPPGWRISLTPAVLNSARRIIFLVEGAKKSAMVARVLYGPYEPDMLPAQRIRPSGGELIWMLDAGAAAARENR